MRNMRTLITISLAVLAVAVVAVVVIRHLDDVMRPINALLRKFGLNTGSCDCCDDEEIFEINTDE